MKSPNGKFQLLKSDFTEVRMGSPLFGSIRVLGSPVNLEGIVFGESYSFSPNSRYLVLQELQVGKGNAGPVTSLLLIELETGKIQKLDELYGGFLEPVEWEGDNTLIYQSVVYSLDGRKTVKLLANLDA